MNHVPFTGLGAVVVGVKGNAIILMADFETALKQKVANYAAMPAFLETEPGLASITCAVVAEGECFWIPFGSQRSILHVRQ